MGSNTVGVIGLGLIGASFAKALLKNTDFRVLGYDINSEVMEKAIQSGAICSSVADYNLCECDIVFIGLYPNDTIEFVERNIDNFKKSTVIVDFCGVKRVICQSLEECCQEKGIVFVGAHPMAGREFSGIDYSIDTLFEGAHMIITPSSYVSKETLDMLREIFSKVGFGDIVITTADNHDKMIAYTSQIAHILSNAYVKSPNAKRHNGYSAGSFKDLTRVAKLNEDMWTEIFFHNKDFLLEELEILIENLSQYKLALKTDDTQLMKELLHDGRIIKEEISK